MSPNLPGQSHFAKDLKSNIIDEDASFHQSSIRNYRPSIAGIDLPVKNYLIKKVLLLNIQLTT